MKKKNVVIGLLIGLAAVLVLGGLLLGMLKLYKDTRPEPPAPVEDGKNITVTVVHKDGQEKKMEFNTNEAYLGKLLKDEGVIEGEEGPYGLMITAVDGETADWNVDQSYWAVYIGEEYATTGIDQIPVYDGSVYRLVYTIG